MLLWNKEERSTNTLKNILVKSFSPTVLKQDGWRWMMKFQSWNPPTDEEFCPLVFSYFLIYLDMVQLFTMAVLLHPRDN